MISFKESIQSFPFRIKPEVLVVEDQLVVQRGIKHLLEALGLPVTLVGNGAEALEKVQTKDYPLILMDLGLPDQDGRVVGEAIHRFQKQHWRLLSVIAAHSSQMNQKERRRCLRAGMLRAYEKPLTEENIQELLGLL